MYQLLIRINLNNCTKRTKKQYHAECSVMLNINKNQPFIIALNAFSTTRSVQKARPSQLLQFWTHLQIKTRKHILLVPEGKGV